MCVEEDLRENCFQQFNYGFFDLDGNLKINRFNT
jgi:hypothetical protein